MTAMVQIFFKHSWSPQDLHEAAKGFALDIKPEIPGLLWKIFLKEEKEKGSCGVYLFDSVAAAQAYVDGDRVAGMKSMSGFSDVSVRVSDVMEAESILADAPL